MQFGFAGDARQDLPMLQAAVQYLDGGGGESGIYLREGLRVGAGGTEYLGVGDDR